MDFRERRFSLDDTRALLAVARDQVRPNDERRDAAGRLIAENYRRSIYAALNRAFEAASGSRLSPEDADFFFNEFAEKFLQKNVLDAFAGEAAQFNSWVTTVASNRMRDLLRQENALRAKATSIGIVVDIADPEPGPEGAIVEQERRMVQKAREQVLQQAIERLQREDEPKFYQVFFLRAQEGYSFTKIASLVHTTERSASNWYQTATQRLQQYVEEARIQL